MLCNRISGDAVTLCACELFSSADFVTQEWIKDTFTTILQEMLLIDPQTIKPNGENPTLRR